MSAGKGAPTMEKFFEESAKEVEEIRKREAEKGALPPPEPPDLDALSPEPEKKPAPEEAAPEKEKPVVEKPKPVEKDWKVEHDKMFGTLSNTIAGLRKELDGMKGLGAEVETLRKENADLKTRKTEPVKPDTSDDEDIKALVQSLGDDDVTRILRVADRMADKKVKEALGAVDKQIGEVKAGITKTAEQIAAEKFAAYEAKLLDPVNGMPDAYEVGNSDKFVQWLVDNDWKDVYVQAHESHNVAKVLDKLTKYKATLAPAETDEEKAAREEKEALLAEQAAGPGKGRGPKPPAPEKKTYTRAEIDAFMAEYNKGPHGKYHKNAKADAVYQEMMAQLRTGKVGP